MSTVCANLLNILKFKWIFIRFLHQAKNTHKDFIFLYGCLTVFKLLKLLHTRHHILLKALCFIIQLGESDVVA